MQQIIKYAAMVLVAASANGVSKADFVTTHALVNVDNFGSSPYYYSVSATTFSGSGHGGPPLGNVSLSVTVPGETIVPTGTSLGLPSYAGIIPIGRSLIVSIEATAMVAAGTGQFAESLLNVFIEVFPELGFGSLSLETVPYSLTAGTIATVDVSSEFGPLSTVTLGDDLIGNFIVFGGQGGVVSAYSSLQAASPTAVPEAAGWQTLMIAAVSVVGARRVRDVVRRYIK